MNKLFEKEFTPDEFFKRLCSTDEITFLSNQSSEKRSCPQAVIDDLHSQCNCKDVIVQYNSENETITFNQKTYQLSEGVKLLLDTLESKPLLINITTMNLQMLGVLLKQLTNYKFPVIYCMYTEPERYARSFGEEQAFDLHHRLKSIGALQGYYASNYDQKPEKWIAFLGFEGNRAAQVYDSYDFPDCIFVITLPSYKPIWQNFIIRENLNLLNGTEDNTLQYVSANSFVDAYEKLENLKSTYKNYFLRVSPFGTKINAMGILLFALKHEGEMDIVYDNPMEDDAIVSKGIGNTHIFDITEFL